MHITRAFMHTLGSLRPLPAHSYASHIVSSPWWRLSRSGLLMLAMMARVMKFSTITAGWSYYRTEKPRVCGKRSCFCFICCGVPSCCCMVDGAVKVKKDAVGAPTQVGGVEKHAFGESEESNVADPSKLSLDDEFQNSSSELKSPKKDVERTNTSNMI